MSERPRFAMPEGARGLGFVALVVSVVFFLLYALADKPVHDRLYLGVGLALFAGAHGLL